MKRNCLFGGGVTAVVFTLLVFPPLSGKAATDSFNPNVNNGVEYIAIQPDGRILIGGQFTVVAGHFRTNLARLHPDGQTDTSFAPRIAMYGRRIVVQPDGKIIVGGIYNPPDAQPFKGIVRFESDGSVDPSFDSPRPDMPFALALQADGKVLAGFQYPPYLARFHGDGRPDTSFNPQLDYVVYDLVMQPDGRILVAGYFERVNGHVRQLLARLNADGTLDTSFNAAVGHQSLHGGVVRRLAIQADGKIVLGGWFSTVHGIPRHNLARVNGDGSLDLQFKADTDGEVHGVVALPNGRLLVVGNFIRINGRSHQRLARLNWDGSLDPTLALNADDFIRTAALQLDGKVLLGGYFTTLGGSSRRHLARITSDLSSAPVFIDVFSTRVLKGGAIQFSFLNTSTSELSVLASEDVTLPLKNWEDLGRATPAGNGVYQFIDADATNYRRRFYRLATP